MKIKEVIAFIGFFMVIIAVSCDMQYSDIKYVTAMFFIGLILLWFGGKDYECSEDDYWDWRDGR